MWVQGTVRAISPLWYWFFFQFVVKWKDKKRFLKTFITGVVQKRKTWREFEPQPDSISRSDGTANFYCCQQTEKCAVGSCKGNKFQEIFDLSVLRSFSHAAFLTLTTWTMKLWLIFMLLLFLDASSKLSAFVRLRLKGEAFFFVIWQLIKFTIYVTFFFSLPFSLRVILTPNLTLSY